MSDCNKFIHKPIYSFSEQTISSDRIKKLKEQTMYTDVKIPPHTLPKTYSNYDSKYTINNGFINCISN
jgi:hypothetical protein